MKLLDIASKPDDCIFTQQPPTVYWYDLFVQFFNFFFNFFLLIILLLIILKLRLNLFNLVMKLQYNEADFCNSSIFIPIYAHALCHCPFSHIDLTCLPLPNKSMKLMKIIKHYFANICFWVLI